MYRYSSVIVWAEKLYSTQADVFFAHRFHISLCEPAAAPGKAWYLRMENEECTNWLNRGFWGNKKKKSMNCFYSCVLVGVLVLLSSLLFTRKVGKKRKKSKQTLNNKVPGEIATPHKLQLIESPQALTHVYWRSCATDSTGRIRAI